MQPAMFGRWVMCLLTQSTSDAGRHSEPERRFLAEQKVRNGRSPGRIGDLSTGDRGDE
jgi:hypothetical protein